MKRGDIAGQEFRGLTAIAYTKGKGWLCKCVCGCTRTLKTYQLKKRLSDVKRPKSCSCSTIKATLHQEYKLWSNVKSRCKNILDRNYAAYGGRGIKIAARWENFQYFINDVGGRPSLNHSLDRIDNDGNYEPGNVRWATSKEQCQNKFRRSNISDEFIEQEFYRRNDLKFMRDYVLGLSVA